MRLIDMDRLRKELMAKGDIPIHEVFNTIWDQPIVNICEVEEQQPCEDCISREEVIEWLKDKDFIKMKNQEENARRELAFLSSAMQQPCEEENPTCTECRYYDKEKHHCPRFCRVIENTMAEITSEQTRWIPVSERLPKIGKDVLATDGVEMFVAWVAEITRGKYEWQSFDENYVKYSPIVAWMPLPEPYKESDE